MQISSLSELKRELIELSATELIDICLRMVKYRRENKELLNYLLFESSDEEHYKQVLKEEMRVEFSGVNVGSVYLAKKSIRRILRLVLKHIKYSGISQTEVELLICFCQEMRKLRLPFKESKVLQNLYQRQLDNIGKALGKLDEDLQFDYEMELEEIRQPLH